MECERLESEKQTLTIHLRCAEMRIEDLRKALSRDLSDDDDTDDEDMSSVQNGSLTGYDQFLVSPLKTVYVRFLYV